MVTRKQFEIAGKTRIWLVGDNNRAMVRFKEVTHCGKIKEVIMSGGS
jgi:hypothetical protein